MHTWGIFTTPDLSFYEHERDEQGLFCVFSGVGLGLRLGS